MKQHMAEGGGFEPPEGVNLLRFSRPPQSAALPSLADQFRGVTKMVEPVGLEPTLPPCKGGVLPLNYGPVKIMVGAAGIEPAASCSQSRCAAAALRSDAVTLHCLALLYLAEPFRATHWRALLHFALPSKISKAVIPMTTAPAQFK